MATGLTQHCPGFDFLPHVYPGRTRTEICWRISDHFPLWAEFGAGEVDVSATSTSLEMQPELRSTNISPP